MRIYLHKYGEHYVFIYNPPLPAGFSELDSYYIITIGSIAIYIYGNDPRPFFAGDATEPIIMRKLRTLILGIQ